MWGSKWIWKEELVVTQVLRGTLASLLLKTGHAYSSVQMRTDHSDTHSLQSYQNLRGAEALHQQRDILGSSGQSKGTKGVSSSSFNVESSSMETTVICYPSDSHDGSGNIANNDNDDDGKHMDVNLNGDDTTAVGPFAAVGVVRGGIVNITVNYYVCWPPPCWIKYIEGL